MSRDFEEEYKNMIAEEVPDLWSRIEGNLKEKNITFQQPALEEIYMQKEKNKKITTIYTKKYAVAACVCLVVAVGGVITIFNQNTGKQSNDTAVDMGMESTFETDNSAAVEEAGKNQEGVMEESTVVTDDAEEGDSSQSLYDNVAGNSSEETFSEDSAYAMENENKNVQSDITKSQQTEGNSVQKDEENPSESGAEVLESENQNYQAIVKITSIENTGEEILYYGEVLPSVYSIFEPGQTITFCIGDMRIAEPEIGKSYKIGVEPLSMEVEGAETVFILQKIEQQPE